MITHPALPDPQSASVSPPRRRAPWPLYLALSVYGGLFLLMVFGWLLYASGFPSVLAYAYRYDFLNVYVGGRAILQGQAGQLYDLAVQRTLSDAALLPFNRPLLLPYTYPPYVAILFAPLTLLSYANAFTLWDILNLLMAAWVIRRVVRAEPARPGERPARFVIAASFMPLALVLLHAQFGLPVLLGLTEAWLALRAGRDWRAGGWLVLGLIKPQLILLPLLVLVVQRRWRPLVVVAGVGSLLAVLSFVVCGNWVPSYSSLLALMQDPAQPIADAPWVMHNWRALVYDLLGTDQSFLAVGLLGGLTLLSAGVVAGVALVMRRAAAPLALDIPLVLAVFLGALAVPHLYLHDMVILLWPGLILWLLCDQARVGQLPPALARRIHLLRWLLGLGPALIFVAQFWNPPFVALVPWYLVGLVAVALWAVPVLNQSFGGSNLGTRTDAGAAEPVLQ